MKRHILAICDLEVAYASHFMEHMSRRKNFPFEIQAFTNLETLEAFLKEQPVEILLISERALKDQVREWDIGQIVVLSEGLTTGYGEYPTVSKYQSSDSVIREVMAVYAAETRENPPATVIKKETKIIGVYSPVGRCLKTTFALILGQLLAGKRATLYLNLESYAGFEQLFNVSYDRTLSDLIYYLRQDADGLTHRLESVVHTLDNLDYVPPAPFPQDITNITAKEWRRLLALIRGQSPYETVILDMGDGVEDICPLLEECDCIFLPVKSDFVSQAKIRQFENLMEVWNAKETLEKIRKIKLPYYSLNAGKEQFLQQLMWSEFGDYVKTLIRKEGL